MVGHSQKQNICIIHHRYEGLEHIAKPILQILVGSKSPTAQRTVSYLILISTYLTQLQNKSHICQRPISPKMAPALTSTIAPQTTPISIQNPPSKNLFPDGLRTSGQHPPLYELLESYDAFPTKISGPTLWQADDYTSHPERWIHRFSPAEIDEMNIAADHFLASGVPLTGITKVDFSFFLHVFFPGVGNCVVLIDVWLVGEFPITLARYVSHIRSRRAFEWERVHFVQRVSRGRMGIEEVCCRVYGGGDISWYVIFLQLTSKHNRFDANHFSFCFKAIS